jgi:hypothetical protein
VQIAILLFEWFTALDAVRPYDLSHIPGAETVFVAQRTGPVVNEAGGLSLTATVALVGIPAPDVVVVPGERAVDGKHITAAGVSAALDMAFTLTRRIAGDAVAQAIQLDHEHAPRPPYDAGSPDPAPHQIVDALRARRDSILY